MIDIDAERVRFEAWILASTSCPGNVRTNEDGKYVWSAVNSAWDSWLAAKRDAITNEVSDEQAAG